MWERFKLKQRADVMKITFVDGYFRKEMFDVSHVRMNAYRAETEFQLLLQK